MYAKSDYFEIADITEFMYYLRECTFNTNYECRAYIYPGLTIIWL